MANLLVVDDSLMDRRLLGGLLERVPDWTVHYAENGRAALEYLERNLPDLILTDLIMPELDGLELVRAVVAQYPRVPIILMTGQGSEEIAVEALKEGAASYVPKSALSALVVDTVEKVLSLLGEQRTRARLLDSLLRFELEFALENDVGLVPALVQHLRAAMEQVQLCDDTNMVRVSVALEEALLNALYYGNLEMSAIPVNGVPHRMRELASERQALPPYCHRRLHVVARISREEAVFLIRDEGRGFNPAAVDPAAPANMQSAAGRGLLLMQTFMDDVRFNAIGNEVTLTKRRAGPGPGA